MRVICINKFNGCQIKGWDYVYLKGVLTEYEEMINQ